MRASFCFFDKDLRLKVAILELLSVCVETQPGLIEIFFDVQVGTAESAEGKKVRGTQGHPGRQETQQ